MVKDEIISTGIIGKGIAGIIFIIIGGVIIFYGWNLHQQVERSYNCIPCSIFQKECPIGYDTEENQQCQDSSEWPWKISMLIPFIGLMFITIPFIELFNDYYKYFTGGKNGRKI